MSAIASYFKNAAAKQPALYYFGWVNLIALAVMFVLYFVDPRLVAGEHVWQKPIKFAASIWIAAWTFALIFPLHPRESLFRKLGFWMMLMVALEIVLITFQAVRGVRSHFNVTTWYDGMIFNLMGIGITVHTVLVGVATWHFFKLKGSDIHPGLLWGVRLGLLFFVVFSMEGFVMAARLSHTVKLPDGGPGLPITNWSREGGDLRVAHFFGLHSLQLLPVLGILWNRLAPKRAALATIASGILYAAFCVFLFVRALDGHLF
ncbi:MAG: hypothetical protein JNM63_00060 [Spirochaetia bacterium]|nr:hypothetical protein [Spirochaetia bacterium]